jgi:hypothetical protein
MNTLQYTPANTNDITLHGDHLICKGELIPYNDLSIIIERYTRSVKVRTKNNNKYLKSEKGKKAQRESAKRYYHKKKAIVKLQKVARGFIIRKNIKENSAELP